MTDNQLRAFRQLWEDVSQPSAVQKLACIRAAIEIGARGYVSAVEREHSIFPKLLYEI